MLVTLDTITAAAARIEGRIVRTPLLMSKTLSDITGAEVWVKFENFQFTAAFKERGALNKLLLLTEAEQRTGVIAMSAGNHAQGVAYHAARLNIPAMGHRVAVSNESQSDRFCCERSVAEIHACENVCPPAAIA